MNGNGPVKLVPKQNPEPESKQEQLKGEQPEPTQIDVIVQDDKVVMQFRRSVRVVVLTSDQAMAFGQALSHCAGIASGKKLIVVPGGPG